MESRFATLVTFSNGRLWEGFGTLFWVAVERRRWQEMGGCEEQSGDKNVSQVHQNLFSIVKITMFNAYQLSTSIKDIWEGADRDDTDALGIRERNRCMNLARRNLSTTSRNIVKGYFQVFNCIDGYL